jgi:5,6-dimethylbenzimidazole synthase
MKFDSNHQTALLDILTWRRDTRHFQDTPVAEHELSVLQNAMELAPSVGNSRPWRVLRVQSPALKKAVRDEFERSNGEAAKGYSGQTLDAYAKLKLAGLDKAPVQLAIFTETDPPEGLGLGRKTMPETLVQSTSMAIYSLWLTARTRNLGVGMLSILDPVRIETLFEVPKSWTFCAYLCIGHPSFEDDTPLLHRVGWQENTANPWENR